VVPEPIKDGTNYQQIEKQQHDQIPAVRPTAKVRPEASSAVKDPWQYGQNVNTPRLYLFTRQKVNAQGWGEAVDEGSG